MYGKVYKIYRSKIILVMYINLYSISELLI